MLDGDEPAFEAPSSTPSIPRTGSRWRGLAATRMPPATSRRRRWLCKALTKLHTYRGEAALLTWLCVFCRHELYVTAPAPGRRRGRAAGGGRARDQGCASSRFAPPAPMTSMRGNWARLAVPAGPRPAASQYADALKWKYIDELPVQEIGRRGELGAKAAESLLVGRGRRFGRSPPQAAAVSIHRLRATRNRHLRSPARQPCAAAEARPGAGRCRTARAVAGPRRGADRVAPHTAPLAPRFGVAASPPVPRQRSPPPRCWFGGTVPPSTRTWWRPRSAWSASCASSTASSTEASRRPAACAPGDRVELSAASRAAFALGTATSVRLAGDTRVRFAAANRLVLERGTLYLDARPAATTAASIVIDTVRRPACRRPVAAAGGRQPRRPRAGRPGRRQSRWRTIHDGGGRGAGSPWATARPSGGSEHRARTGTGSRQSPRRSRSKARRVPALLEWVSREQGWQWALHERGSTAPGRARRVRIDQEVTPEEALAAALRVAGLTASSVGTRAVVAAPLISGRRRCLSHATRSRCRAERHGEPVP